MTSINRTGLELIAQLLGLAREALVVNIGDKDLHPKTLLDLEAAFCRLRGSTLFYDTDYGRDFVHFNESDPVGLGIQGAKIAPDNSAAALPFPVISGGAHWFPQFYGPPCPEGFGIWYYNAWKGNNVAAQPGNVESGGSYATRLTKNYPVRYDTNSSSYVRVPFYQHARWISYHNPTGSTLGPDDAILEITLSVDDLEGVQQRDPDTDMPLDLRVMYYAPLVQNYTSGAWEDIGVGAQANLVALPFRLVAGTAGSWKLQVNIPSGLNSPNGFTAGHWWHVVLYWGSLDPAAQFSIPSFRTLKVDGITAIPISTLSVGDQARWPRKNFFRNDVHSKIHIEPHYINDSTPYLVAQKRHHFSFVDGNYTSPGIPDKYPLPTTLTTATSDFNSLLTVVPTLLPGCSCAMILAVKTSGDMYTGPECTPVVLAGPVMGPEFTTSDWGECPYFPPAPLDYVVIAKFVVKRAPGDVFGIIEAETNTGYTSAYYDIFSIAPQVYTEDIVIIWAEQTVPSHALPPLGDVALASAFISPLFKLLTRYRSLNVQDPIVAAANILLVTASRVPTVLVPSRAVLKAPTGRASVIFRQLLKQPVDDDLQPTNPDDTLAFAFSEPARGVIQDLATLPPSTEMMRFNADHLFLTGERLDVANTFEIYQEPINQCSAADTNSPGSDVGLDYTLRMDLEDGNQNVLRKDWCIMASRYLLTTEEYAQRVRAQQTTLGYYTFDQLNQINEWRLYRYTGIVPDLTMGQSRLLETKVVSPPDSNQITEEQFRANLAAQGMSQKDIDEAVLRYLEDGGVFYVIDLSHYDNNFVTMRNVAISTAVYTYDTSPYWASNVSTYFKLPYALSDGETELPYSSLYADAFTIAQDGLDAPTLESYGSQAQTLAQQAFTIDGSTLTLQLDFDAYAFHLASFNGGGITEIGVQLKTILNNSSDTKLATEGTIQAFLYSDNNGSPDILVATGGVLNYSQIQKTQLLEYRIPLIATIAGGSSYWIVIQLSSAPQGGDIVMAVQNLVTGYMDGRHDTVAAAFTPQADTNQFVCSVPVSFVPDAGNATGSLTNSGQVRAILYSDENGRPGTQIAIGTSLAFSAITTSASTVSFTVNSALTHDTLYWVVFEPTVRPRGGSITIDTASTLVDIIRFHVNFNGAVQFWDGTVYKPWLKMYAQSPNVLGAFNRDSYNITQSLPPPNRNREVSPVYQVEGHWAFTCQPLATPSILTIYPRAVNDSGTWKWVKPHNKIYVCARMLVGGVVKDYYVTLDPVNTPGPVQISTDLASALVFLYIAKTAEELQNGTHGAPAGDRLVLRST